MWEVLDERNVSYPVYRTLFGHHFETTPFLPGNICIFYSNKHNKLIELTKLVQMLIKLCKLCQYKYWYWLSSSIYYNLQCGTQSSQGKIQNGHEIKQLHDFQV